MPDPPVQFASPSMPVKGSGGKAVVTPQPVRPGTRKSSTALGGSSGAASSGCGGSTSTALVLADCSSSPPQGAYLGGGGSSGEQQLSFELLQAAYVAAKEQVSTTEASKKEAIAKFKMEMSKSQAAEAADEFTRQLKYWSERIAELDMQLTAAQHQVEEHERSRGLVQEAYQLQQQRAQASARARCCCS